jgi:hypothetical protein
MGRPLYSSTHTQTQGQKGGFLLFTLEKETLYPLCKRLGGHRSWSEWAREISPHRDFNTGPSARSESLCRLHSLPLLN